MVCKSGRNPRGIECSAIAAAPEVRAAHLDLDLEPDRDLDLESAEATRHADVRSSDEEPWPDEVNCAQLLNAIVCIAKRPIHIAMPREAALAVALWVVHTYASDVADFTAYILITSPVRECSKTTLLDVLEHTASTSAAAVRWHDGRRSVSHDRPPRTDHPAR